MTLIVTAVALGASAGMSETAATAIKDAYQGLKSLLVGRQVDVSGVERKPESPMQRAALEETLREVSAGVDDEVVAAAQQLTEAVAVHNEGVGAAIGVNVRDVQAEFLRIASVRTPGPGVNIERSGFRGGIDIGPVAAGGGATDQTGGSADPSVR